MIRPHTIPGKISKIVNFGPHSSLYAITLSREMEFSPGQYVMIPLKDKDGNSVKRAYSIASSPSQKKEIELLLTRHEGGVASAFFEHAEINQPIDIFGPIGIFKLREPVSSPVHFIATVA